MILKIKERQDSLAQLEQLITLRDHQEVVLRTLGLGNEAICQSLAPLNASISVLEQNIAWFDEVTRGEIPPIRCLTDLGKVLVGLRLAAGISKRELARRVGVHESNISRDESTLYDGITVDRAQRVLEALGATLTITVMGRTTGESEPRVIGETSTVAAR